MVAVEARERVEHGGFHCVGVDAVPVAFGGVVAGAGEAGVVAVDLVLAGRAVQPFQPCQKGVRSSPAATRAFFSAPGRTSVSASWSRGNQ